MMVRLVFNLHRMLSLHRLVNDQGFVISQRLLKGLFQTVKGLVAHLGVQQTLESASHVLFHYGWRRRINLACETLMGLSDDLTAHLIALVDLLSLLNVASDLLTLLDELLLQLDQRLCPLHENVPAFVHVCVLFSSDLFWLLFWLDYLLFGLASSLGVSGVRSHHVRQK